jgi:septal ring factor EnvC (AmiA/AmiB activator)
MVTLEQVRQLETKIGKAIEYVNRVSGENARLRGELDGGQKRIAELENTIQRFREDQSRIEEGILAALERLDQFEDVVNQNLSNVQAVVAAAAPAVPAYPDPVPANAVNTANAASTADTAASVETDAPADGPDGEDSSDGEDSPDGEPSEEAGSEELDIF